MNEKNVEIYENLSDNELVSIINSGNLTPLQLIISRYYPTILMYVNQLCPKELREDAVQEANFALYHAVRSYESDKSGFSTFAGVCIKRSVMAFVRNCTRKKNIPAELVSSFEEVEVADGNSPEKIFFERNDYESLAENIKLELSHLEYKVLQLYISGYRYSVIADMLSITEKSVNNAMLRIRKKLRQ